MKKIVLICIAVILCVLVFAAPMYYRTFFNDNTEKNYYANESKKITLELMGEIQSKYLILDNAVNGMGALVLNQDTGQIYWVDLNGEKYVGSI
jgi:hypothetical protein